MEAGIDAVDTSVFAKAAELLARPLSPTALEKEAMQEQSGAQQDVHPASPSAEPKAKAKGKAKSKPGTAASRKSISGRGAPSAAGPGTSGEGGGSAQPGEEGSILAAVDGLSLLQKDLKGKMSSPSFRNIKAPVPKMRREPRVLTEEERSEKLGEIDALERQLQEARGTAAAITAAAAAAVAHVESVAAAAGVAAGSEAESCSDLDRGAPKGGRQQAHERVRAQRRQEAQDRRERAEREAEERLAKQREAEAKVRELEKLTKERMQARLREERARDQQQQEEARRQGELREQRAAGAEELRQQAARRVAEREQLERQRAREAAEAEAEMRSRAEQENEARAAEGRERVRARMLQHARDRREQRMVEEEVQQRRREEESRGAFERQQAVYLSQQRARARAQEFRARARAEEEEQARLEAEMMAREQAMCEVAAHERQRRRHWRASGDGAPRSRSPSCPSTSSGQHTPLSNGKAPPHRDGHAVPPRPPSDRFQGRLLKKVPAPGAPRPDEPARRRDLPRGSAPANGQVAMDAGRASPAPGEEDDGTVRCTVGFFGIEGFHDEDDDEGGPELEADGGGQRPAAPSGHQPHPSAARRSGAASKPSELQARHGSRGSSREAAPRAGSASGARAMPRAYSQPPPSRLVDPSHPVPGRGAGRVEFEDDAVPLPPPRVDSVEPYGSPSGQRGSPKSDPTSARQQAARAMPWKQKAIQVQPTDYYLDMLKAGRGNGDKKAAPGGIAGGRGRGDDDSGAVAPAAWDDGAARGGYAAQMRQRASDVEATQRREEGVRQEKGYAVLQRVQMRALQAAPPRSISVDSAPV